MRFKAALNLQWIWLLLCLVVEGCASEPTAVPTASPPAETWNLPTPTLPSTLPGLIAVLSGENAEARIGAAKALGAMGPDAEPAVPALTKNLYHFVPDVREAAAWALGQIGPGARPAVPVLITVLLADSSVHAREEAARALAAIGDPVAIPALASGLYDKDPWVRIHSAEAIAQLTGQSFPGATPTFLSFPTTPPITREYYIHEFTESGEAVIVLAAREWWKQEGWQQDWSH